MPMHSSLRGKGRYRRNSHIHRCSTMYSRISTLILLFGLVQPGTVTAQDVAETTAPADLYLAAKEGRLEQVKSLIAGGADVNAVNAQGRSALMSAVYKRNRRIVRELLVEGANVNTVDAMGRTALMIAVITGDHDIAQMLIDAGADVSVQDKSKNTAITLAERRKDKKLEKMLDAASS